MKQIAIVFLILSAFAATSCKKEETVDVKLQVKSETTGLPIANARVELAYYEGKKSKGDARTISLGVTDASGNISATNVIKGKSYDHSVLIYADGYGKVTSDYLAISLPYEPGEKMDQSLTLKPVYHYLVNMNNVNCSTPYDSAWVAGPNNLSALNVGCTPKPVYFGGVPSFGCSNWYWTPQITLTLKVRRGTTITNSTIPCQLTEGQVTTINVNY